MNLAEKLEVLSAAARYDVSCSSSGSERANHGKGIGNSVAGGICHSFADDGRCISLLKVLLTNACLYDCAYCANRRSNDIPRAAFTVAELVELTMGFYVRNYIEGLFLSSGIIGSPDATMERLVAVAKILRQREKFNGYIHLKAIPGADPRLIYEAGLYVDRMSVNVELPSRESLEKLAPDKPAKSIFGPMRQLSDEGRNARELQTRYFPKPVSLALGSSDHEPLTVPPPQGLAIGVGKQAIRQGRFMPAGQSTQVIIGASPEHDLDIIRLSSRLYQGFDLKRVYYSAYIPINEDPRLPFILQKAPLAREHRLYQADWLLRFYGFSANEILDENSPWLDLELDPKAAWALRHVDGFPIDIQTASQASLLRVPGIGPRSAKRILDARRSASLREEDLAKLGVVMKRARPFVRCRGSVPLPRLDYDQVRRTLLDPLPRSSSAQLELFA